MALRSIARVEGRACVLPGDDIDTDRILPARFLRTVTFDELGARAFADDRCDGQGRHPLDDPRWRGATLLVVARNFGCGSSREHAPQALMRFGFRGFIGASFGEIFAVNCAALGLPCLTLVDTALASLVADLQVEPSQVVVANLVTRTVTVRRGSVRAMLPEEHRRKFLDGTWEGTAVLLEAGAAIEATAARLPYCRGFEASV